MVDRGWKGGLFWIDGVGLGAIEDVGCLRSIAPVFPPINVINITASINPSLHHPLISSIKSLTIRLSSIAPFHLGPRD